MFYCNKFDPIEYMYTTDMSNLFSVDYLIFNYNA